MSSDKAAALRAPAAPPALSPIVQLLPTGYRDIQPFQRGQGWHSNGKATARLRHAREVPERVVFPAIPSHQGAATATTGNEVATTTGPSLSVVVDRYDASLREEERDDDARAMSPSVAAIPVPPPRRPSAGNQRASSSSASSSGSFRTRAFAASSQSALSPTASGSDNARDEDEDAAILLPDPATMEKLWQEYNERTRHPTKTVDKEAYHRKMQRRYNESKALRERIARLEMELEDAQRERDEALEAVQRSAEQAVQSKKWKELELEDPISSGGTPGLMVDQSIHADETPSGNAVPALSHRNSASERSFASIAARVSMSHRMQFHKLTQGATNPEEVSYREKATKLERTMAVTKEGVAQLQARLVSMHENDLETIKRLRAQLELEQQASKLLSVQLRETNTAFRSIADDLVLTQVALEKEQIEKQIVLEQIQAETRQLISDQRRKELQSRVKNVVRTLGKEALHQKMEALHTRVMTAEHHMRVAQLEVQRLTEERARQQHRIEEILSSREIKYHTLAAQDGGIPGILKRAITLYRGTRTVNDQFLLVQMLYEDRREPADPLLEAGSNQADPPVDPEDGFCIHVVVYEAFTAQDDYLTFHLRDIKRLVPDAEKYLARFPDRKKQRFLELAELLFAQCQIGYKNGHIVLTERSSSEDENVNREKRQVVIYRGCRFIRSTIPGVGDDKPEILVDLVVNEVHNPSTSQLWWLEVQATTVDYTSNQGEELQLIIDSQVLKSVVSTFAGYRPSESVQVIQLSGQFDEQDAFGIHEDLLLPLFERLEWRQSKETASRLVLLDLDGEAVISGGCTQDTPETIDEVRAIEQELESTDDAERDGITTSSPSVTRVLDHRSIVSVDDTFFCVRIEEIWDGELMLRITMEEPADALNRYQSILHEEHVSVVARYLFKSGMCDKDHSASIKFGLPQSLHDPMCRLLKKHARPVHASESAHSQGDISFDSLLRDAHALSKLPQGSEPKSDCQEVLLTEARHVGRRRIELVTVVGDGIHEQLVQELLANVFTTGGRAVKHSHRGGYRLQVLPRFAFVTVYSGFPAPFEDLIILDVWRILSSMLVEPRIAISRRSFHGTLQALGVEVSTLTAMD